MYHFKWASKVGGRTASILPLCAALALLGSPAPVRAATLFDSMGGEPVLRDAVQRFSDLVVADDRINFTFAEADMSKFKSQVYDQLCALSAGPCHYGGRDMRTAHEKLNVTKAEFNALAEDLYLALQRAGVPYRLQNRLMAKLAPMERDIVKHSAATPGGFPTP